MSTPSTRGVGFVFCAALMPLPVQMPRPQRRRLLLPSSILFDSIFEACLLSRFCSARFQGGRMRMNPIAHRLKSVLLVALQHLPKDVWQDASVPIIVTSSGVSARAIVRTLFPCVFIRARPQSPALERVLRRVDSELFESCEAKRLRRLAARYWRGSTPMRADCCGGCVRSFRDHARTPSSSVPFAASHATIRSVFLAAQHNQGHAGFLIFHRRVVD